MSETLAVACPACHQSLSPFKFHEETVDICIRGCGIWFDAGELQQVANSDSLSRIDATFEGSFQQLSRPEVRAALEDEPELACPVNGASLSRYEWNVGSGIVIDQCPDCKGAWLDSGELEGYTAFIQKFQEHPPELTPALQAKMQAVRQDVEARWETTVDESVKRMVPWDLWFLDDLKRHILATIMRQSA